MNQKPRTRANNGEKVVKDIRGTTREQYSAGEKIRIETAYAINEPKGLPSSGFDPRWCDSAQPAIPRFGRHSIGYPRAKERRHADIKSLPRRAYPIG